MAAIGEESLVLMQTTPWESEEAHCMGSSSLMPQDWAGEMLENSQLSKETTFLQKPAPQEFTTTSYRGSKTTGCHVGLKFHMYGKPRIYTGPR